MTDQSHTLHAIVARQDLDFDLDGDIPKYWFDNDPFKTRFADALSTLFPEGERYFITSVRAFRDQASDESLLREIALFMRQEGQHGIVHDRYNDRLRKQGINVDGIETLNGRLIAYSNKHNSPQFNIANTAAAEHLTSLMAHSFFKRRKTFQNADRRMRAMYAWHAMEEIEHKAIAFDVMQKVAKVGYTMRVLALVQATLLNIIMTFGILDYMLRVDGYGFWQRLGIWAKGLWWLYGWGGLFPPTLGPYLRYFKPGFHPWQIKEGGEYHVWLKTYEDTGDPVKAGDAVQAAAA